MNKIILLGRTTKKPEINTTNNNTKFAKFTLAVNRKFKNEKGEYEVDFIDCVAWKQTAEIIEKFVDKGNRVAVSGTLQTRTYETSDNGKRKVFEVVCDEVELLENKEKEKKEEINKEELSDDGLPF